MSEQLQTTGPRLDHLELAVCGFLLLAVVIVFGQTVHHDFVEFDDNDYVYQNRHVLRGLTAEGIAWAATATHANNWHPLTWLSHMLDCQLYGRWPGGHHLTSVLLHAANAILLFLVLRRMTGDLWPSAFVAVVFAAHPLRVESVAWVAERKDVLSGFFFMLTLWAYLAYVRRPYSWSRYLTVVLLFAAGVMAKPMLVTAPFVLLLLDYWPLGRLAGWGGSYTAAPGRQYNCRPNESHPPGGWWPKKFRSWRWRPCPAWPRPWPKTRSRWMSPCFPDGFPTPWFLTWPILANSSIRRGCRRFIHIRARIRLGRCGERSWCWPPFRWWRRSAGGEAPIFWSVGCGIWACSFR